MGDTGTREQAGDQHYEAEVIWTTHGVPHITAANWGSLGFGQGWACARDNAAAIADHVLKVRSQRSRFLGRGEADRHLHSDLGYLALGIGDAARAMAAAQPPAIRQLIAGYAAGYNAWLAEHGADALPAWCRGAPWVGPIDELDLYRVYVDLTLMGSGRNLVEYIGSALSPADSVHEPVPPVPPEPLATEPGLGSNGWAFGGAATANRRGMVMANPHFPWWGEGRFWECHLRLPGELDVYGVSLVGAPLVQMGFNRHVAWSHTFSCGSRFTVYQLSLVPGSPTTYRYGDDERPMDPTTFEVEVATDPWVLGDPTGAGRSAPVTAGDIGTTTVTRTLWRTHYGPMLNLPMLGWSDAVGFTFRDANEGNDRFFGQVLAMDTAGSVGEFQDAVAAHQGTPWVNTLVADDAGRCWYVDPSTTPNLSVEAAAAFEEKVSTDPLTQLAYSLRVVLLDGSDPRFEWQDDPRAAAPGILPYDELPQIERDDYVFNANDPYWLVHGDARIAEHSPLCGLYHRPVSARTRMNALLAGGRGPFAGSGPDGRFTSDDVADAVLGNHSVMAELLLDAVLERIGDAGVVDVDGTPRDIGAAAAILARWDRRFDVDSVGAVLWREMLASFDESDRQNTRAPGAGPLWDQPFDPDDPVGTPRGLAPPPAGGPDPVVVAVGRALDVLDSNGIAPDVPLGAVQFAERGGRRWPIHGGDEVEGIANIISSRGNLARADLDPHPVLSEAVPGRTERSGLRRAGYEAVYGVSFLMVVSFTDDGPDGRGLLVYGQSPDPDSPHNADQVGDFSAKRLRPLRFTDAAIAADPAHTTRTLRS